MSHLVRPLGGVVFLAAVGFVTLRNLPPVRPADTVGDWVVVGLFALGVAAAVVARDTLAAVAALGFVGLLMAALFVTAGAPDVAVTLVLVEVLTGGVVAVIGEAYGRERGCEDR